MKYTFNVKAAEGGVGLVIRVANGLNLDLRDALRARADVLTSDAEMFSVELTNVDELVKDFRDRAAVLRELAEEIESHE